MVSVTVNRDFYDLVAHRWRRAGERFDASESRANAIAGKLPGYVVTTAIEPDPAPEPEPVAEPDYESMRVAELKAMLADRGVDVPKGAKKADLVALARG